MESRCRSDSGIAHLSHRYARFGNANLQSRIKSTVRNPPYRAPRLRAVNAFTKALYFKETTDHEALRIFTTLNGLRRTSCLRARPGAHPIGGFRFRLAQTNNNFGGVGALASFQAFKELKLEAQMSYDFNQTFTDSGTGTVTFSRTNLRILHGEFGPRMNIGHHAIQPFVTLKGGFVDFRIDGAPATLRAFFQ